MMKKISNLLLAFSIVYVFGINTASAQFPLKLPKLKVEKPKQDVPKTDGNMPQTGEDTRSETPRSQNQSDILRQPTVPNKPMFMIDTLEIKVKTEPRFYKVPTQNDNTSWYPQVNFKVFYDNSVKLRYTAEWFNPNGSPWFSESLDASGIISADRAVTVQSPRSEEELNTKAVQAVGTYGLKITNAKTGETVFQGKFKVNKLQQEPALKNKLLYYVDNDWNLPVGYVGFEYAGHTSWEIDVKPIVYLWFKGALDSKDLEARLFYNNQQIASTDEGGMVNNDQKRGEDCFQFRETCQLTQWLFMWENFKVENNDWIRTKYPNATYTKDKRGEYTVKIFHKGVQVREAKFTIDQKGWVASNAFSNQIYLNNYKVAVPVKVMGNLEKWNAAVWKTDVFYGNPLSGFTVQ